jgi:hypothetical protein
MPVQYVVAAAEVDSPMKRQHDLVQPPQLLILSHYQSQINWGYLKSASFVNFMLAFTLLPLNVNLVVINEPM